MSYPFAKARSTPKISTLPRQQSEATAHLEIYKLLVEKNRLQQELATLDQRRHQILDRLSVLNTEVAQLDKAASPNPAEQKTAAPANPFGHSEAFNTLFLEY
jgi:hypothetical protein